ncbi:MAG: leucine-rich repeat domain-containing protein [Clostridia bacterium]|nr:leucine-rich repeat domain-containing protein [Clostridia bacterium]
MKTAKTTIAYCLAAFFVAIAFIGCDGGKVGQSGGKTHVHDFAFSEFVWSGYTAKAKYICAEDRQTAYFEAEISRRVLKNPSCTEEGEEEYTAFYDGHTDVKFRTLERSAHNFVDGVCTVCGRELSTAGLVFAKADGGASYLLVGYTGVDKDVFVPAKHDGLPVKTICARAFSGADYIESVTIGDNVETVDDLAFEGCVKLKTIYFPESVTEIKYDAFTDCNALTGITVSPKNPAYKSVNGDLYTKDGRVLIRYAVAKTEEEFTVTCEIVAADAFTNAKKLKTLNLGSVSRLDGFSGCTGLTRVNYDGTLRSWCDVDVFVNPLMYAHDLYVTEDNALKKVEDLVIPDGVTEIKQSVFAGISAKTITVPDGVKSIGFQAFAYCTEVTDVALPESVTSLGYNAFTECKKLKRVSLGAGIKTVAGYAFRSCQSLESVIMRAVAIENGAFDGCRTLKSLFFTDARSAVGELSIAEENDKFYGATRYYYSQTEPPLDEFGLDYNDNYWYYGDDGAPVVWKKQ